MNGKKSVKELTKIQTTVGVITLFIAVIALIASIAIPIVGRIIDAYAESHSSYEYETRSDWKNLPELYTYLDKDNKVVVFDNGFRTNGYYYEGASLIVLYTNFDWQERVISGFNVRVNNITRNYDPNLMAYISHEHWGDSISIAVQNLGWGLSDNVEVNCLSVHSLSEKLEINFKDSALRTTILDPIEPGTSSDALSFSLDDFEIVWGVDSDSENRIGSASIKGQIIDKDTEDIIDFECSFCVSNDVLMPEFVGGGYPITYVIMVDTSDETWEKSYDVYQSLPGKQTIRIPIIIMPDQSCSMDIQIEFETLDGETILLTPMESAEFIILNTDFNKYFYADGSNIQESELSGLDEYSFPFFYINSVILNDK